MEWRILSIEEISANWNKIFPEMQHACIMSGEKYTAEYFMDAATIGTANIWADEDVDNFILTDILDFPLKRFARVVLGMGKGLKSDSLFIPKFEKWAKENNCDVVS